MLQVNVNDTYSFQVPANWHELTAPQLKAICQHLVQLSMPTTTDAQSYHLAKVAMLLATTLSAGKLSGSYAATEVAHKLLPHLQYLKHNQLTKQLLPIIRVRKGFRLKRYHGPAENFSNLTMAEFEDCEYLIDVIRTAESDTDKDDALNLLCATLYREYDKSPADERIAYVAAATKARAQFIAHADVTEKLCILLWYIGCRNSLVADYPMLFDGKGSDTSGLSWADFAHSLAGPVLGNIDQVYARPVRQVFFELRRIKLLSEEQQQQTTE